MVKKSRNLVRLATLSAAVCAALTLSGCHLDTSGARQNGEELSDATPYNIATDVPSDVTVDVASSALPGEIVDVELTYDAAKVQIDALLVNGSRAASIDADSFYFEMPGSDEVDANARHEFSYVYDSYIEDRDCYQFNITPIQSNVSTELVCFQVAATGDMMMVYYDSGDGYGSLLTMMVPTDLLYLHS